MKISIVIPVNKKMKNGEKFLKRCLDSIQSQTFKDYEVVTTFKGNSAENTNAGIKQSVGEYIKILHQDDYLSCSTSLQKIVNEMPFDWLVTGCIHDDGSLFNEHYPVYNELTDIGVNTIGAPSVLAFKNKEPLLFNEKLVWMFDIEYYRRLFDRYGLPTILNEVNVTIGIHDSQATNLISDKVKLQEENLIKELYV